MAAATDSPRRRKAAIRPRVVTVLPEWLAAAETAFRFVTQHMTDGNGEGARLFHAWRNGAARHVATLDDYAKAKSRRPGV